MLRFRYVIEHVPRCFASRPRRSDHVFPTLEQADLEEHFSHGWGPGGQNVNKAVNCVTLRHKPTGIIVKVHEFRTLPLNRTRARERLLEKLDDALNGEESLNAKRARFAAQRKAEGKVKKGKTAEMRRRLAETAARFGAEESGDGDGK